MLATSSWRDYITCMRWAGRVAHTGRRELYAGFWLEKPKERDHSEDLA